MANRFYRNTNDINSDTPGDGDSLFFVEGTQPATQNVDKSGLGAGGLSYVNVAAGWTGGIGTFSAPFKAEISAQADSYFAVNASSGAIYYTADGNADVCDLLRMTCADAVSFYALGGTITAAELKGGKTFFAPATTVPTIRATGSAHWDVQDDGSAGPARPTGVTAIGSRGILRRGVNGTLTIGGGAIVTLDCQNTNNFATTTVTQHSGTIIINGSGTIGTYNLFGGGFNIGQTLARPFTITTLNVWRNIPNLDELLSHRLITVTTANKFF